MLYLIIIVGSMLLIALTNTLTTTPFSIDTALLFAQSALLGTLSVIAWDGLQAWGIRRLPAQWFSADRTAFSVSKQERAFYRKLHINEWKNLIPELGLFTGFCKSKFLSSNDSEYLARFLLESNYGVLIHLANAALGFLIVLLPWCNSPSVAIPIAMVNALLNLLPAAILRFNTAPLKNLYQRSLSKKIEKCP